MKKPPPGLHPGEGNGTTHTKEGSAVKHPSPIFQKITTPAGAAVDHTTTGQSTTLTLTGHKATLVLELPGDVRERREVLDALIAAAVRADHELADAEDFATYGIEVAS